MSPNRILARTVLPIALSLSVSAAPDWAQWRGPARDGVSPEKGLLKQWPKEGPKLAWQTKGLGKGLSSVAIADGRLFTMGAKSNAEWVIALDPGTQKELWRAKVADTDGETRCTPTIDGGLVYAVSTRGELVCLQAADGKEVWRKSFEKDFGSPPVPTWQFSESPLIDGEKVIVTPGSGEAMMVALNKKTGAEFWRTKATLTGKGHEGAGYTGAVISNAAGIRQYVTMVGKGAIGVSAADGKLLWHYNRVANDTAVIPTPLVWDDFAFVSSGYGTGAALLKIEKDAAEAAAPKIDGAKVAALQKKLEELRAEIVRRREARAKTKEGTPEYEKANAAVQGIKPEIEQAEQELAKTQGQSGDGSGSTKIAGSPVIAKEQYFLRASKFQNHHGGMVRIGDYIYAGTGHNNGFPICLDWKTGNIVWNKDRGPGKESAAVIAADGNLYFRYQDGIMALIAAKPTGYEERGAFKLPSVNGPSWAHPAIHDGKLYLRDQDNLMCYDLRNR